jgi:hypothetical protein
MKLIGCGVFRTETEAVLGGRAGSPAWLSPGLHVESSRLEAGLQDALGGREGVACLYGAQCHPDMGRLVGDVGVHLPGKDCISAFLGDGDRRLLESKGAFVMTPGWLRHWREIFVEGLRWDEVDARQNFGFYESIALLDFGLEPIDDLAVLEFFDYTGKPVEIVPATLDRFRSQVERLLEGLSEETVRGDPRGGAG